MSDDARVDSASQTKQQQQQSSVRAFTLKKFDKTLQECGFAQRIQWDQHYCIMGLRQETI